MSHETHPLEIPEIVCMVGRYLDKATEIAALAVSPTFRSQISATAWNTIVVDFRNQALYNDTPSYTDMFKGGPRLLPWESLEQYGSHVRTITIASKYYRRPPPASYPRPASTRDLLTMLGELPNLKCMTLDISEVEDDDISPLLEIFSRLKSLDIRSCVICWRNWKSETPAPKFLAPKSPAPKSKASKSNYDLEELSISSDCGIPLEAFISRSPLLKVLRISPGKFEERILKGLVESFRTEGMMPSLQHLDVCLSAFRLPEETISEVLTSVRCLRSFQWHFFNAVLSIDDFRPHFLTITTIDVRYEKPEFWQEIMSSCEALVKARAVFLLAEDIIGGKEWACTELESLDLNIIVRSQGNQRSSRKVQENALFRRIAKLVKLNHLSVHTGWHGKRKLRAESWGILLGIKTLRSLELGSELTADQDKLNVLRRFSKKQVDVAWKESDMYRLSDEDAGGDLENEIYQQALAVYLAEHHN